ncbi:hypothetical protein TPA0909_31180 [Streptomyces albus]|nr:hypothetical protein TPA0909_31180 [Streptomyces albus]
MPWVGWEGPRGHHRGRSELHGAGAGRLGAAIGGLAFVPGVEGAGRIGALGPVVTEFAVGDGVAWV